MTHLRRWIAAVAAAALLVPATALAATRVSVKDDKFSKRSVTISKGAKVRWVWTGHSRHNVTVVRGPRSFRSATKRTGSFTHRFTKRGTYRLICTVHPAKMRMTVTVR